MNVEYFRFSPSLVRLMKEGKAIGASGREHTDVIVSSVNNLIVLRELILERKPAHTLEIGLAFGGSALTMLATLKEIWPGGDYSHDAIDPFQKTRWDQIALEMIKKEGLENHFKLWDDFSCYRLPAMIQDKRQFGLVYVDGSHLFEDVFLDMYFVNDLLAPGGVVVFDDCMDPHVKKVMRFVKWNYGHNLAEIDLNKYCAPKSLTKRIGNYLGYKQARGFVKTGTARREWDSRLVPF